MAPPPKVLGSVAPVSPSFDWMNTSDRAVVPRLKRPDRIRRHSAPDSTHSRSRAFAMDRAGRRLSSSGRCERSRLRGLFAQRSAEMSLLSRQWLPVSRDSRRNGQRADRSILWRRRRRFPFVTAWTSNAAATVATSATDRTGSRFTRIASVTESLASASTRVDERGWIASMVSLISTRVCSIWERMSSVVAAAVAAVLYRPCEPILPLLHLGLEPLRVLLQRVNRISGRQFLRLESGEP